MNEYCGLRDLHSRHLFYSTRQGFHMNCPGNDISTFAVAEVFPEPQVVTDGSYRAGDCIRLVAEVTRLTPAGNPVLRYTGVNSERALPKSVVAELLRRGKTPGQVLWEELRGTDSTWDSLLPATKDRFERIASKIRGLG